MPRSHVLTNSFLSSLYIEPFTGYYTSMASVSTEGGGQRYKHENRTGAKTGSKLTN